MAFVRCPPKSVLRDARKAKLHMQIAQTNDFYRKQLALCHKEERPS